MHFKVYQLLLYTNLFFIFHYSNAFNITNILNKYPSFSTFNQYLSETKLAAEINLHKQITVFAVPNNAISRLSGKPHDVLKNLLKVHVVVGYYDVQKLRTLANQTGQMTTLFQTTGLAMGQQGFLKATVFKKNIFIGSATQGDGSPLGAILVRSVACEPCNISVLSISTAIVPVGIISGYISPVEPPKISPVQPPVSSPKAGPKISPVQVSPDPPPYAKPSPPPFINPSVSAPTESPTDAPEYSGESPPKPTHTPASSPPKPAGPPATSACRDSSNFAIDLYVVLTILLLSNYLTVQT